MKFTRTLFAAAAISAFALPAAAQDPAAGPALTPPVAPSTSPPAEQMTAPPANPVMQSPVQPGPAAMPAQQPTTQTAPAAPASATPATPATPVQAAATDLVVGAPVLDAQGQTVGTIETADAAGAVVSTGTARGRMNLDAFYKNERGLLIGYTRAEFEGLVTGLGGPEAPDAEETPPAAADPAPAQPPAEPPQATATPEAPND